VKARRSGAAARFGRSAGRKTVVSPPKRAQWLAVAAVLAWASMADAAPAQAAAAGNETAAARVNRLGYRLSSANLALCRAPAKTGGFVVQALDQYDRGMRDYARIASDLDEHVAVLAIAPDSPAQRAGLAVDDRLIAVNGRPLPVAASLPAAGSYATVEAALAMIQQAFERGDARFDVVRGGVRRQILIRPEPGCAVRVQLVPASRREAFADDRYASVSTAMERYAAADPELAFVIAHELAHGFLRHEALLGAHRRGGLFGGGRAPTSLVRETERQADHVALYMLARAGFEIAGIPAFLRRFARSQGLFIAFARDHPSSGERIAAAEATIAEIRRKGTAGVPLMPAAPPRR
jgi:hypothetical protein